LDAGGQDAYLRRRVLTSLDWSYKNYELTATGHFTDGFQDFDLNDNPRRVGSSWTWDLRLGYTFKGELGPYLRGTTLAVGSINIFNRPPPVVIAGGSSSDNYPGYLYTSEGREVYVSLDKRF
jgi:hypothetical protein